MLEKDYRSVPTITCFFDGNKQEQVEIRDRARRVAEKRGVEFCAYNITEPGMKEFACSLYTPEGTGNNDRQIKFLLGIPPDMTLDALRNR